MTVFEWLMSLLLLFFWLIILAAPVILIGLAVLVARRLPDSGERVQLELAQLRLHRQDKGDLSL